MLLLQQIHRSVTQLTFRTCVRATFGAPRLGHSGSNQNLWIDERTTLNLYQPQFAPSLDIVNAPAPQRTLIIASTPRCGSHMLGHAITTTHLMGVPYEYCNPANLKEWQKRIKSRDNLGTLRAIMQRRTTPNRIFSIKAHYDQTKTLGGAAPFLAAFPDARIVHIRRADVLRQAISFAIAKQTGVWISNQEPVSDTVRYDERMIIACLRDIVTQNARWTTAMRASALPNISVEYEAVCHDLPGTIHQIAALLDINLPDDALPVEAPTQPQAVAGRTEDWIARFGQEKRHGVLATLRRTLFDG
jgi:trehalose 2-sulfotransferase